MSGWEQARPVGSLPITPEFRAAYDQLVEDALCGTKDINLEVADLREVLRDSCGISIGRGEASGPARALRALAEAHQHPLMAGNQIATQGKVLLFIQTKPEAELQMDELTDITETLQKRLGYDWEMIFGHDIVPDLPHEICIIFVLAPSANAQIG